MLFSVRWTSALLSSSHQKEQSDDWGKKERTEEITPESQWPFLSNEGNKKTESNIHDKKSHV
jgi:hypothetical protein